MNFENVIGLFMKQANQGAEKVEGQKALLPAGVLGADPISLMPQHFPRESAKRRSRAMAANQFFSTVCRKPRG